MIDALACFSLSHFLHLCLAKKRTRLTFTPFFVRFLALWAPLDTVTFAEVVDETDGTGEKVSLAECLKAVKVSSWGWYDDVCKKAGKIGFSVAVLKKIKS